MLEVGLHEETATDIAEAIRQLRARLDISQEAAARAVGCGLGAWRNWETGRRVPSGYWLIKIMRLAPDAESLAAFGVHILKSGISNLKSAATSESEIQNPKSKLSPPIRHAYEKLFGDLETIIASGQSQLINTAEERLNDLAERARVMTPKRRNRRPPTVTLDGARSNLPSDKPPRSGKT